MCINVSETPLIAKKIYDSMCLNNYVQTKKLNQSLSRCPL